MTTTEQELQKRLLYILHRGFVEVRNLALAAGQDQIADLADVMEFVPRFVNGCTTEDLELLRSEFKRYQDKYRSSYDYPAHLDEYDVPDSY
jgi:hypothetical protein